MRVFHNEGCSSVKENCFFKPRSTTDLLLESRGRTARSTPQSLLTFCLKVKGKPKTMLKIWDCRNTRL